MPRTVAQPILETAPVEPRLGVDLIRDGLVDGCGAGWDAVMFDSSIVYTVPAAGCAAVEERVSEDANECPWSLMEAWSRSDWRGLQVAQRAFDDPRVTHWIRVMTRKLWFRWSQDWFRLRFPEVYDLTKEVTVKLWTRLSVNQGVPLIPVESRTGPATGFLLKMVEGIARDVRNSAQVAGRDEPRMRGMHDEDGRTDLIEGSISDSAGMFADAHESASPERLLHLQRLRHAEVLVAIRMEQEKRREIGRFKARAIAKDYGRSSFKKSAIYLLICHGLVPDLSLLELAAAERGRGLGLRRSIAQTRELMASMLDVFGVAVHDENGRPIDGALVVPMANKDALKTLVWILDSDEESYEHWVNADTGRRKKECESVYRKIGHAKKDIEQ
jgi:hypothetical protein